MADDTELEIVNSVDSAKLNRKLLGFENSQVTVFFCGIIFSALLFMLSMIPVFPKIVVYTIAPIPFFLSVLYIVFFMVGKPPHYTQDCIEGVIADQQFKPYDKVFTRLPDGMLFEHFVLWNGFQNGIWACGMELDVPSMNYAKNATRNTFLSRIRAMLHGFAQDNIRIQIYWSVSSNYTAELYQYRKDTESLPPDSPCRKYRELRHDQYKQMANSRRLRRERVIIFVSRLLSENEKISWNHSAEGYDDLTEKIIAGLETAADRMFTGLKAMLHPCGIGCRELDNKEILNILKTHFNPSQALAPMLFQTELVPDASIREQVIRSDISQTNENGAAFIMDGMFYNVLVLKEPLPPQMFEGYINHLTKLTEILDYELVVNVIPEDTLKVKKEIEKNYQLVKAQAAQPKAALELDFAVQDNVEQMGEIRSGRKSPLKAEYFIYIHGINAEEIVTKTTSIKAALSRMNMGFYQLNNSMSAINAFFQGTPGWLFGGRNKHNFRVMDEQLAPLLPISSTYTGLLNGAEAIYNGEQNNLVGLKQFAKAIREDSDPQHALLFGKTGSGKSVLTADLIMQTHGFYSYTVIIDYGLSYKALAEKLGTSPIYLGPSSNVTINYFDTRKLPLTGEHLSLVSTVLRVMSDGLASDGMISRYLKPFYISRAKRWYDDRKENHELVHELTAKAILTDKYLRDREADDEVEAYQKACEEWKDYPFKPDELNSFFFEKHDEVFYQCFAMFAPDEFPTHTEFVKFLRTKPLADEEDFKTLQLVTDALELWQKNGKNGRLFDGITNIEMTDSIQYFELSGIPSNDSNFKFAAGALIQMLAMRTIERMDRKLKKRLIIDEANSFFEIPQGAKVIESALTKYRKHRCSVLISFQQYEMLNQSEIKESITSNIHQYLLMGQTDRNDVEQ
ncbi:MAG: TraC family protein, partial [Lentisphaeria bacterium]|nr:TraC family protein [Lentisphaeria bacterium]